MVAVHTLGPLAPLAELDQFIVVKLVLKPDGKTDKLPIDHRTGRVSDAHNPDVWTDYGTAAVAAAIAHARTGEPHRVGFVVTEADPFVCIDVDGCLTDLGLSPTALDINAALPGAVVELSQSGKGLHFWLRASDCPEHAAKHTGLHVECYSSKRFILLGTIPSHWPAREMAGDCPGIRDVIARYFPPRAAGAADLPDDGPRADWHGPADDLELLRRAMQSKSAAGAFGGKATFADLWHADAAALARAFPDAERGYDASSADAALCQHLCFWTGCDARRTDTLMRQSNLMRSKWDDRPEYLSHTIAVARGQQGDVLHDRRPEPGPAAPVAATAPTMTAVTGETFLGPQQQAELFKGCVYVVDAHRVLVPGGNLLKPEQFNAKFGGYTFAMDARNERVTRKAFEALTESQVLRAPKADGTCFFPQQPYGAFVHDPGRVRVNTYWPVEVPRKFGDPTPFLNHVAKLLPDQRDRSICMAMLAALVQQQGHKFPWAIVLQGVEGNGKTLLSNCVAEAIGRRYVHWPKASKLAKQFNAWMPGKTFYAVEDIHTSEHVDVIEELKPMITGGKGLEIEGKGVDQISAEICGNFLFNTNHKTGIRKTRNDRRFCWMACAQQAVEDLARDGMDGKYFEVLYGWLNDRDGHAIVAEFLWTYPIPEDLDPTRGCTRAPRTSSTDEALRHGMGYVEQLVGEAIEQGRPGFCGGWVSSVCLGKLLEEKRKAQEVPPNARGTLLESMGYVRHPGLAGNGGQVSHALQDNSKPKLYLLKQHPAISLHSPAAIAKAYSADQMPRA